MAEDIFKLDYQVITNKLSTLVAVPETTESAIDESYDENTKNFLSFVSNVIDSAKDVEKNSVEVNCKKIDRLVKDLSEVINTYLTDNSLNTYYDNVLSTTLTDLNESASKAGTTFSVDNTKATIIEILSTFSKSINEKKNAEYEVIMNNLKDELSNTFDTSLAETSTQIQSAIEQKTHEQVEKMLPDIKKDLTASLNLLLVNTVPSYVDSLKKTFDDKFNEFVVRNFKDKSKQSKVVEKLNKAYNAVMAPIAYITKFIKHDKEKTAQQGKNPIAEMNSKVAETKESKKDKEAKEKLFKEWGLLGLMVKRIKDSRKKIKEANQVQEEKEKVAKKKPRGLFRNISVRWKLFKRNLAKEDNKKV